MITLNEVKQICNKLSLENTDVLEDNLSEDISCIVYRNDIFECDGTDIMDRHIDIEFSYGEYYEVCDGTSLFQYICTLCNLPLLQKEQEIVIYSKDL